MPLLSDLKPGVWFRLATAPQSKPYMLQWHEEGTGYSMCASFASNSTALLSKSLVIIVDIKTEKIN